MSRTDCQLIYCTVGNLDEARQIAATLVAEELAACVNLIPGMESVYVWKEKLTVDQEVVLLAKTTAERGRDLITRIEQLHSYDCPAIIALDIDAGSKAYLNWIRDQVEAL